MLIETWLNKQIVVYIYNGIILSNKKKWITDTNKNIDWLKTLFFIKEAATKRYILYDCIHVKSNIKQGYTILTEIRSCLLGAGGEGIEWKGAQGNFLGVMEVFTILIDKAILQMHKFIKWYNFKWVHFVFAFYCYRNIVDLQCYVNYCCTAKWFSYTVFFNILFYYGLS